MKMQNGWQSLKYNSVIKQYQKVITVQKTYWTDAQARVYFGKLKNTEIFFDIIDLNRSNV